MPTIPPNNSTGLYGIDGSSVAISNDVTVDNLAATGNITAGGYIAAQGNITSQGNISADYFIGDGSQLTNINAANVIGGYGNANVVDLLDSFGSNVIVTTGNITGGYIFGNGSQLTGLPETYSNANVTTLLANFGSNTINTTGNITGGTFSGSGAGLTNITGANVTGTVPAATVAGTVTTAAQPNITSVGTLSSLTVSGNVAGGNISTAGQVVAVGNISGNYILGNGSQLTGLPEIYGNANVTTLLANFGSNTINTTGNITGGNLTASGNVTGALFQTTGSGGNIIGANVITANTFQAQNVVATGNVSAVNLNASGNITTSGYFIGDGSLITNLPGGSYGNANVTSLLASGTVSSNIITTGNVSGTYILGNGSQLTGLPATYNDSNVTTLLASFGSNSIATTGNITSGNIIANGSALTNLPAANIVGTVANAAYAANAGQATVADSANAVAGANVTGTVASATQANTANVANSVSGANVVGAVANATFATSAASATVADSANAVAGGNVTGQVANALVAGTVYTNAQPNITSVGTLSSLTVSGNIGTGGILTDGYYYANGTPVTFGGGGTYGDSNVNTLLASWGSNTLTTTGNVSAGNLAVTGANAQLRMAGSTSNKVNFGTTGAGSPQVGTYSNGAKVVLYDNISNTSTGYAIGIDPSTMWFGTDQAGSNFEFFVGNVKKAAIETDGSVRANGVIYTGTDGTAGQILTTYGNGQTYWTSGGGGSYGDSNVVTLMSAFGSNTITTTGNVTVGNLNMTGRVIDTSGVFQVNAAGNIVLVPTGSTVIEGPTNITGGRLTTGAVTYANTDGTAGQVLTTFGNGVTYFSTVSGGSGSPGGSDGQIQYNNGGAFGGNVAMTFDDATGNVAFGNLVMATTAANTSVQITTGTANLAAATATAPIGGRLVIGSGFNGNISGGVDIFNTGRIAPVLFTNTYSMANTNVGFRGLATQNYITLNGNISSSTAGIRGGAFNTAVGGGAAGNSITLTAPIAFSGGSSSLQVGGGTSGNLTSLGNITATTGTGFSGSLNLFTGSNITGAGFGIIGQVPLQSAPCNIGTIISFSTNNTGGTVAGQAGNVFVYYNPNNTATYGVNNSNTVRASSQYYFLRNDDDVAQCKLGSLRLFNEFRNTATISSGAVTIDKNNGQVQYVDVTENITSITFSNFVRTASDSVNTDQQTDTVTMILRQDSTGRTVTMPSGSGFRYAGGVNVVGTTANSVTMISVTGITDAAGTGIEYLITISPEFV